MISAISTLRSISRTSPLISPPNMLIQNKSFQKFSSENESSCVRVLVYLFSLCFGTILSIPQMQKGKQLARMQSSEAQATSKYLKCHFCDKSFLFPSMLIRHMKKHVNERTNRCKICKKGWVQSSSGHSHSNPHPPPGILYLLENAITFKFCASFCC